MNAPARYPAGDQVRRAMIGKVKIAQKELQLDDGAYRAMLHRITGETSAADCTVQQLGLVLDEMKAKGWTPKFVSRDDKQAPRAKAGMAPTSRRPAQSPMAKKARAMWISLHQLGVVRDPSEAALESFGRRQLGVDRLQWADEGQAFRLIEALKAMAERAGWSQQGGIDEIRARLAVLLEQRRQGQAHG